MPSTIADRLRRYRKSVASGLLPHKILQVLGSAGVQIQPYYFYREDGTKGAARITERAEFEFAEAGPFDAAGIAAIDPQPGAEARILDALAAGKRCFVLRRGGEIVASTWCDIAEIGFEPCRRNLRHDEAYLYGMETLFRFRGNDLAPYLRSKCIESLAAEGRRTIYSYTDYFNRPAVRFKEKIRATVLFKGLYLGLSGVGGKNWVFGAESAGAGPASEASKAPPVH